MAPHTEDRRVGSSKTEKKKIQEELLEKLKLEEEKEKRKMEKEAKRRAELEKIKNESLIRQADLLAPIKKEKPSTQPKHFTLKNSQLKPSKQRKQQSHNSENKNNQGFSYEVKTSDWNTKQPMHSERRYRNDSSSSENSWKKYGENWQSSSKYAPVADSMWNNKNEHFPMLGAEAPVPQVNVWEERKYKQEEIQSLLPRNEYDEEAMLRQALQLSLMEATREEERKQKLDAEYRLQMEALECNPKLLDNSEEFDELTVTNKSGFESINVLESTEGLSCNQNFSRNAALSSIIQKNKTSSSGGARPKINKIIDSFGGWGLKNDKKDNFNSVINFANDIDEKSSKAWKPNHSLSFQKDVINNNAKKSESVNSWTTSDTEIEKHSVSDSWSSDLSNDVKKSPPSHLWESKVFQDQKETAFDVNEVDLSYSDSATDVSTNGKEYLQDKSSNNVADKWLSSEDEPAPASDGWDDVSSDEKLTGSPNSKMNSVRYPGSFSDNSLTKFEKAERALTSFEAVKSVEDTSEKNSSKGHNILDVSMKSSLTKDTSTGSCNITKEKELSNGNIVSQFENTYNYILEDTSKSKDGSPTAETFLSTNNVWSDKFPNKSTASNSAFQSQNSPQTEFPGKEAPFKFGTVEESFLKAASNSEIDTPPILPPHSVSEANESIQTITAKISGNNYTTESPPILPTQASPQMPSQYLFNPAMLPGVNPMYGLGMDPITARQMLMLSNPFFASQLLAMEQYYRTLGMPVDLFSFPSQPLPNMPFPGIANSLEQNIANLVNANMTSPYPLQSQYQDQSILLSKNTDSVSPEKHLTKHPSGVDKGDTANFPDTIKNDLWYASLLSNDDDSIIPPPKPPTLNADQIPAPYQPSETNKSASSFVHNLNSNDCLSGNPSSSLHESESHKSVTALEANMPKTVVTGWGDLDDKFSDKSCNDDFGWGTESLPAKSVKNPSMYEDKKVVHRQPARQPQLSRFQRNRRFN